MYVLPYDIVKLGMYKLSLGELGAELETHKYGDARESWTFPQFSMHKAKSHSQDFK